METPFYEVKDINLAPSGKKKIEWAYKNMPVLRAIEKELIDEQPFKGLIRPVFRSKYSVCHHE